MLDKLMRDHAQMRERADRLLHLLDCAVMPPWDVLADARWQLSSLIMQHLAYEDCHLYGKLLRDGRPHVAETGRRFQSELSALFDGYTDHAQYWTPETIANDWDGFRAASRIKTHAMLARIEREECELFPLVGAADIDVNSRVAPTANWTRDAFAIKDAMLRGSRQGAD